jgi:hypothetical protein
VLDFIEGYNGPLRKPGKEGVISGGVFDQSTHAEDGPVTWEALASPRPIPVSRRAGDPSPTHGTYAGTRVVGLWAQNKRPHRGKPLQGEPEPWLMGAGSRRAA